MHLYAGELLPSQIPAGVQEAAGVGADLNEIDALVDRGRCGQKASFGNVQCEQPATDLTAKLLDSGVARQ